MSEFILDGQKYNDESLSVEAYGLLLSLRFAEKEISNINRRAGVLQTARNAYALELARLLPEPLDAAVSEVDGGVLTINERKFAKTSLSKSAKSNLFSLMEVDKKLEDVLDEYSIADTAKVIIGKQLKAVLVR